MEFPTFPKMKITRNDIDQVIFLLFAKQYPEVKKFTYTKFDYPKVLTIKRLALALHEYFTLETLPKLSNIENQPVGVLFYEFLRHSKELLSR